MNSLLILGQCLLLILSKLSQAEYILLIVVLFFIPGTTMKDMEASVTSPSHTTEICEIVEVNPCHYSIKFTPTEMGIHTVSVKHRGIHIPGSPFQFTVGPITDGGSHKVKAIGPGLIRGEVSKPCKFKIHFIFSILRVNSCFIVN